MRYSAAAIAWALVAFGLAGTGAAAPRLVDGYARPSVPGAMMGAAYVTLSNDGPDDRLVGVTSPLAAEAALFGPAETADGVLHQQPHEGGLPLPSGGTLVMERGGDCIMLFDLDAPLQSGQTVPLRLRFEHAAPLDVTVTVDPSRESPAN